MKVWKWMYDWINFPFFSTKALSLVESYDEGGYKRWEESQIFSTIEFRFVLEIGDEKFLESSDN